MKYRVLIEQDEDGVYVAEVPVLPGCISQGQTREEAVEGIKEAIAAYIWNFRHINNAEMKARIRTAIESVGYECPTICSPEELGGIEA